MRSVQKIAVCTILASLLLSGCASAAPGETTAPVTEAATQAAVDYGPQAEQLLQNYLDACTRQSGEASAAFLLADHRDYRPVDESRIWSGKELNPKLWVFSVQQQLGQQYASIPIFVGLVEEKLYVFPHVSDLPKELQQGFRPEHYDVPRDPFVPEAETEPTEPVAAETVPETTQPETTEPTQATVPPAKPVQTTQKPGASNTPASATLPADISHTDDLGMKESSATCPKHTFFYLDRILHRPVCGGGEPGYYIQFCPFCGAQRRLYDAANYPAIEHDYVDTVQEVAPFQNGFTTHTCTRCGSNYTDNVVYWDSVYPLEQPGSTPEAEENPPAVDTEAG